MFGFINFPIPKSHIFIILFKSNKIFSNLEIKVSYQDSGKSYVVQSADLLVGTIRRKALNNQENINIVLSKFVNFLIILP